VRARLEFEATGFFLPGELDWLEVAGGAVSSGFEDNFVSPTEEEELSAIAGGEAASDVIGTVAFG
jgi:hypothetical protein